MDEAPDQQGRPLVLHQEWKLGFWDVHCLCWRMRRMPHDEDH